MNREWFRIIDEAVKCSFWAYFSGDDFIERGKETEDNSFRIVMMGLDISPLQYYSIVLLRH